MGVILLLLVIWAVVLIPPALRSHAARQEAFLVSLGTTPAPSLARPADPQALRIQRRRRIAGGLLVAMTTTLLMGLLPTFRVLLFVHLFLLDSFIAYIALLAHGANKAAQMAHAANGAARPAAVATEPAPAHPSRRRRPTVVAELGPVAPLA